MTRVEFSKCIVQLMSMMIEEGEDFLIDYCLRSAEEQNRLFKAGKSKCDGYKIKSAHQFGKAVDIYFVKNTKMNFKDKEKYEYWHWKWECMGGRKMIEWDWGHFEGRQ